MSVLQITHLQKSFKSKTVLSDVNLSVPAHTIYGFVGKNGAGKTTTMKIILGLLKADRGEVKIDGETVIYGQNKTNQWIGYVPDVPKFYTFMTAREYMQLCGGILDMDRDAINQRSEALLAKVGLAHEEGCIKGFSRGMKQRLGIAQALLGNPKLLICDEPTSALDPIGRKEILDILYAVSDQTTILFSTHILSDVERICSDVAFLNHGEIVKQGSIADLKQSSAYHGMRIKAKSVKDAEHILRVFPMAEKQHHTCVKITGTSDDIWRVNDYIAKHQIAIEKTEWLEPTLEDLFVEVESE